MTAPSGRTDDEPAPAAGEGTYPPACISRLQCSRRYLQLKLSPRITERRGRLRDLAGLRATAEYIDERGAGWIYGAVPLMVGDGVAFYARGTLQKLGTGAVASANDC